MVHLDHHVACPHLRISDHLLYREYGSRGHAGILEQREPITGGAFAKSRRQQFDKGRKMLHARGIVTETFILAEFRHADDFDKAQPVRLVGGTDVDPAVSRLDRLVRGA